MYVVTPLSPRGLSAWRLPRTYFAQCAIPSMSDLTASEISRGARNEPVGSFTLTNSHTGEQREFDLKDLEYDSYIEFVDLARPIITAVAGAVQSKDNHGEFQLAFNPIGIDFGELIRLAGKELPRMALIVCRQSDPKIKLEDVKRIGRRPMQLLEIVLMQIKQNQIVQEFADFFPRIATALQELLPAAQGAMTPVPAQTAATA